MRKISIPFNKPSLTGKEFEYIQQAIEAGHISGDGSFTRACSRLLEQSLGEGGKQPKVLLTTSCTHALEMAALLLDLAPGDEVIFPSFTFVSTVNAFVLRGIRPVFCDIRPDTMNLDEQLLEGLINSHTKAIAPVHYSGVGCEMDKIMKIAQTHDLHVVEDNAHGLFGKYKGRHLGTFGSLSTLSFHETKNFSCGEGGALVINNAQFVERAEIIREKGTNRSRFFRGQIDKYTWVDIGSSYLPSDVLAAFLLSQLEARTQIQGRRSEIWHIYNDALKDWASSNGVQTPFVPPHCEQAFHMYYLVCPTLEMRTALIAHLKQLDILSVFHYQPLHLSDMGRKFGGKEGDCRVTEWISDTLLRLPFYTALSLPEQKRVIECILQFSF